jgi:hypothetical protein
MVVKLAACCAEVTHSWLVALLQVGQVREGLVERVDPVDPRAGDLLAGVGLAGEQDLRGRIGLVGGGPGGLDEVGVGGGVVVAGVAV